MQKNGLVQITFEDSIYPYSLQFKDTEFEESYITARAGLKLLSIAAMRYITTSLIAFCSLYLVDLISALSDNANYTSGITVWIFYLMLIPIIIGEALCFFCAKFVSWRGVIITVLGGMVLFHNDFGNYEAKLFYPFVGTEYNSP